MKNIIFLTTLIFTLFACKKSENSPNVISQNEKSVLLKKIKAETIKPAFGGNIYGDLVVLQRNENEVFVWTTLQEFYGKDNAEKGTGLSLPLKINIKGNPITQDNVGKIEIPRDGSLYTKDIKRIFPENLHKEIFDFPNSKSLMQMNENLKNNLIE